MTFSSVRFVDDNVGSQGQKVGLACGEHATCLILVVDSGQAPPTLSGAFLGGAILSSTADCWRAWHRCKWHWALCSNSMEFPSGFLWGTLEQQASCVPEQDSKSQKRLPFWITWKTRKPVDLAVLQSSALAAQSPLLSSERKVAYCVFQLTAFLLIFKNAFLSYLLFCFRHFILLYFFCSPGWQAYLGPLLPPVLGLCAWATPSPFFHASIPWNLG